MMDEMVKFQPEEQEQPFPLRCGKDDRRSIFVLYLGESSMNGGAMGNRRRRTQQEVLEMEDDDDKERWNREKSDKRKRTGELAGVCWMLTTMKWGSDRPSDLDGRGGGA